MNKGEWSGRGGGVVECGADYSHNHTIVTFYY